MRLRPDSQRETCKEREAFRALLGRWLLALCLIILLGFAWFVIVAAWRMLVGFFREGHISWYTILYSPSLNAGALPAPWGGVFCCGGALFLAVYAAWWLIKNL